MARDIDNPILHAQAVEMFTNDILPGLVAIEATQSGNIDYPLRCETWNNWVDSLCKDGQISDWQYENWSHPPCND